MFTVSVHLVSKNSLISLQRGSDEEIEKQHGGRWQLPVGTWQPGSPDTGVTDGVSWCGRSRRCYKEKRKHLPVTDSWDLTVENAAIFLETSTLTPWWRCMSDPRAERDPRANFGISSVVCWWWIRAMNGRGGSSWLLRAMITAKGDGKPSLYLLLFFYFLPYNGGYTDVVARSSTDRSSCSVSARVS